MSSELHAPAGAQVELGHDGPLYFLAFDHRGAFARAVLDVEGEPTPEQERTIVAAKEIIFEGAQRAAELMDMPAGRIGVLVDERYGAGVAAQARSAGIVVAMPVEEPDREVFAFTYGERFGAHIERLSPDFAKVLVRWNADGDADANALQGKRLLLLSQWLRANGRKFLFELIVSPTEAQLAAAGGEVERFELEQRPQLIRRAMAEVQAAGIEVDVWKLEGIDTVADAEAIVAQARAGEGRERVVCTVLGAGAAQRRVDDWLRVAAEVDGFVGFAIGRSIWRAPLRAHLAGTLDRAAAAQQIARRYRRFVEVYGAS
jgi:myo-inositol catabolism protein IolC